jgi:hypothetical protein
MTEFYERCYKNSVNSPDLKMGDLIKFKNPQLNMDEAPFIVKCVFRMPTTQVISFGYVPRDKPDNNWSIARLNPKRIIKI